MVLPTDNALAPEPVIPIERWPLRGGATCLDFANTIAWRPLPRPYDGLRSYDDLLLWSHHAGLLSLDDAARLRERATGDPEAAAATLAEAARLREAIHRLFTALAHGRDWETVDLATINYFLVAGMTHSALASEGERFVFRLPAGEAALAMPLWLLAESAARLLLSGDWRRVRECPGHDCGWLFLDQTKNGNRRWCDSADCGNRARVRAHQQRQRERARQREPSAQA